MKTALFSLFTFAFLVFASTASATGGVYGGYGAPCQPIYGGGETCISKGNLVLNKTVQNPVTDKFVDNLSFSGDPRFGANQDVVFQITVVNTGDKKLKEVTVTDTFPSFINFVSGPGVFDSNTRVLSFKISSLNPDESRTYTVKARVVGESSLPSDQAVNCVINQAKAVSKDSEGSDVSQLCIEKAIATTKGGLPVMPAPKMTQTPGTGPEMLSLLGLIPAGLGGLFLRKRSSR